MSFKPGIGGRPKGVRNKLSGAFLADLLVDWQECGASAIKICRIEDPVAYCRLVASTLPRDLHIEATAVNELADAELDQMIETLRQRVLEARQETTIDLTPVKRKALPDGKH